jgi:hypothetical protein
MRRPNATAQDVRGAALVWIAKRSPAIRWLIIIRQMASDDYVDKVPAIAY